MVLFPFGISFISWVHTRLVLYFYDGFGQLIYVINWLECTVARYESAIAVCSHLPLENGCKERSKFWNKSSMLQMIINDPCI